MKRRYLMPILLALVVTAAGCSRCGVQKPATVADVLPADAAMVLLVPDLGAAAGGADALLKKFSRGAAEPVLNQVRFELERVLGFSPFDASKWRELGVDPAKGLGICWLEGGAVAAVALADEKAFRERLTKLLKERSGAEPAKETMEGVEVTSWSGKDKPRQALLRLAESGGFALIGGGETGKELLARVCRMKDKQRLGQSEWYSKNMPQARSVVLLARAGQAAKILSGSHPRLAQLAEEGLSAGVELGQDGMALEVFQGLGAEQIGRIQALAGKLADAGLERRLPPDSLLALKVQTPPKKLLETLFAERPDSREKYAKAVEIASRHLGEDFEGAVVSNLTGNFALAAGFEDAEKLQQLIAAGAPQPKLVSAALWLLVWAEVKDPARLDRFVEQMTKIAGERFPGRREKLGPLDVIAFTTEQGYDVRLLRAGNLVGFCLGAGCQERARLAMLGEGGSLATSISGQSAQALSQPALLSGVFNLHLFLEKLGALDSASLGGMGMAEAMVLQVLHAALGGIGEMNLAVRPAPGGLWLGARVGMR